MKTEIGNFHQMLKCDVDIYFFIEWSDTMARAPFQVLIIPFRKKDDSYEYCIFKRTDMEMWQFVSGGGEDSETYLESAIREMYEETSVSVSKDIFRLKTISSIPTYCFKEIMHNYPDLFVIPEYTFAVKISSEFVLSHEHSEYQWVDYDDALLRLKYDSNKTALYELSMLLKNSKDISMS